MDHDPEDVAAAAAATAAAADDEDEDEDNDGTIMPPKVKPLAAMKKPTATTETRTLPTPRPPSNFSVDTTNKFGIATTVRALKTSLTWSSMSTDACMRASTT